MRKKTAKRMTFMAKERQSPCPVRNALQNMAGNMTVG